MAENGLTAKDIGDRLKSKNIKPSMIRIKVMQYLLDNRTHPDADTIYRALIREIPTLSKTSIYNTMKVLSKGGLVLEIPGGNNQVRYDGYMHRHGHFTCATCGKLLDVDLACASCRVSGIDGAKILEEQLNIKGICPECTGKEGKNDKKRK
ncbi:MAG: transcriptional repressor [Spirochaetia bacterium]|nr:transcriptional repressor [Spirochaetia bacterium]